MDMEKKSPRKNIDWEKIEAAYRAGRLSLREIGAEYGCSDTAIRKKAKKEEPKKDAINPKIPSREELEIIVKTSFYEDEVEEALAILNEELSTHCGLWNQWLDYVKFQTKIELELQKGE